MQLMRRQESWGPLRELEELSKRMNRYMGLSMWPGTPLSRWSIEDERESLATTDWSPSCNISETDKEYRVRAELPNVRREDVHVTLEEGVLTIRGDRREESEETGVRFHRRELSYGSFLRRFVMPSDADESKVDATFKDGMLNISIGRMKGKLTKGKEIAVHS